MAVLQPLVAMLQEGTEATKEAAACVLGDLATISEERRAHIVMSGALQPLLSLVLHQEGSEGCKEQAARVLRTLADGSDDLRLQIVKLGVPSALLLKHIPASSASSVKGDAMASACKLPAARELSTKVRRYSCLQAANLSNLNSLCRTTPQASSALDPGIVGGPPSFLPPALLMPQAVPAAGPPSSQQMPPLLRLVITRPILPTAAASSSGAVPLVTPQIIRPAVAPSLNQATTGQAVDVGGASSGHYSAAASNIEPSMSLLAAVRKARRKVAEDKTRRKEQETLDTECIVCLDRPMKTVLQPCGHVQMCRQCCEQYLAVAASKRVAPEVRGGLLSRPLVGTAR